MTSTQEFNCIFCKETFDNKEDLQIHFRKHGDPKFNQSQKGKSRSQNEAQTDEKKGEDVEMVSCDVCSETFPTISKAITHKHKVHPDHDAKYFCPWCGKLFTMKHLYNKHLQSNHANAERNDNTNFHCDACEVHFFVPSAMMYHNKFFHRQDTDLPSIGQSKKLKMCQQEVIQINYCAFCGDEYDNRVNLHKHMTDDHGDENQSPEDILRCPLCEAIFYHLDAYEVHLTFHTTEDLYTEKNEMFEQIIEFSLETVPPLMEKVENVEPQEDVESAMNAVGIDKFLELATDNLLQKAGDASKSKSKKHKKHKKRKKEAITLDEFLNMNQDVFGEGLDFQGIEEVPTQVVAKRLKKIKAEKSPMAKLKMAQSTELAKLKKQGIVVKVKPTRKPTFQKLKVGSKVITKTLQDANKPISKVQSTPDEVLSKLINQSNNQIKIVKKCSSNNTESDQQEQQDPVAGPFLNSLLERRCSSPENIEVECDVNMHSEYTSSENEMKEGLGNNITESCRENILQIDKKKPNEIIHNERKFDKKSPVTSREVEKLSDFDMNGGDLAHQLEPVSNKEKTCEETLPNDQNSSEECPSNVLRSISTEVIIKPALKIQENAQKNDAYIQDKNITVNEKLEGDLKHNGESSPSPAVKCPNNSLNALKHLSHLITIKSVSPKTSSPVPSQPSSIKDPNENDSNDDLDAGHENVQKEITEARKEQFLVKDETSIKPLESFKNLSKNITIKSVTNATKQVTEETNNDDDDSTVTTNRTEMTPKDIPPVIKLEPTAKITEINHLPLKVSNILNSAGHTNSKQCLPIQDKQSNINLLKHLTNVTAKPINKVKNVTQELAYNKTARNMQNVTRQIVARSFEKKPDINEDIEIFNIEDSDDDLDSNAVPTPIKTSNPMPPETNTVKSLDALRNISKNVTIKSVNQQATTVNKSIVKKMLHQEKSQHKDLIPTSDFSDDDQNILTPIPNMTKQNTEKLKNTLKSLGKHITVKSGKPSPNYPTIRSSKDQSSRDDFDMNAEADSNDSSPGKVKITEITEKNNVSEDDMEEEMERNNDSVYHENLHVKSPGGSNSDNENFDEADDEDLSDIEYQIKANTLQKPDETINNQIRNLKNINKNITIKTLADKKGPGPHEMESKTKCLIPNINKELSIKPFKQFKDDSTDGEETFTNRKSMTAAAQVKRSIINQNQPVKHSLASSSQHNTINKEVTVQTKTFQTKTVIQEITTTVTKTIKTVNQTVKQEVQQSSSQQTNLTKFQKVQGMKSSNQQFKNFQGLTVRHATPALRPAAPTVRHAPQVVRQAPPVAGTKIRGGPPHSGGTIRPSNQLVPFRPTQNTARMSVPRMPIMKKTMPSQPRPNLGRPLKMSPNAVNINKRTTDEPMGHFSCFKKPKESLIPVSEIPSFGNDQGEESTVQFTSHMSKSNFTSATKTVRGNAVVTQMKSEVSASSQQLERLNNMTGLKIVKTSQSKQASKVEEKCDVSPSKKNTLEAIEKLQKQGLLVKKPRLEEVSNESDENNDYITEEPDD